MKNIESNVVVVVVVVLVVVRTKMVRYTLGPCLFLHVYLAEEVDSPSTYVRIDYELPDLRVETICKR
jgi:hypothetical protein